MIVMQIYTAVRQLAAHLLDISNWSSDWSDTHQSRQ